MGVRVFPGKKDFPSPQDSTVGVPVTHRRDLIDNNLVYTPHTLGESSPALASHCLRSGRFSGKGAGLRVGGALGPRPHLRPAHPVPALGARAGAGEE